MKRKNLSILLFILTGVIVTIGAVGNTLTSIPAMQEHFVSEPSVYWFNRMTAFMVLGATGLYYTALTTWVGVWLVTRKDASKHFAGKVLLVLSILPHIPSLIALPLLTPSDWPHMITHILAITFTSLGLLWYEK